MIGRRRPAGPDAGRGFADLSAAVAASTATSLPVFLVSALAVQLRESLHFGTRAFGITVSLYFLGAAISTIPLVRMTEALGGVRVMRIACLVSGVLLMAGAAVGSWAELAPVMVVAGMSNAAMQPASNLLLVRRIVAQRQGLAFGIKQASVPLSTLLAGLAVPAIGLTIGWRWAFVATGVVAAGVTLLLPRPRTSLAQRRARRTRTGLGPGETLPLVVLSAGFGLGVAAATSLAGFLVTASVAGGVAKGTAGLLVALGGAAAGLARIIAGVRADRRGGRHLAVVSVMLVVGGGGFALLAAATAARLPALLVPAVLLAFSAGWGWNGLFNLAVVRRYLDKPARATAITQAGGRIGSIAGPLLFGVAAVRLSYAGAWLCTGACAMAAAGTMAIGSRLLHTHPVGVASGAESAAS